MILKDTILKEAVRVARQRGLAGLTRRLVANGAACAVGTVNYHFESMADLCAEVILHAVQAEDIPFLARNIGDPKVTAKLSPELKARVAKYIAGK
jgi:AcrR family transcriptional regulator